MRIRTQADVDELDLKIKNQLGIDVRKYRNDEAVESIVSLLIFPEYILTWVIRPVLVAFVIFIAGFFVLHIPTIVAKIVYGSVGFSLFILAGLLSGLLFLIARMRIDMWGIIDYSLGIMRSAVSDLHQVNAQVDASNRKEAMGLLFKGVIHIVTLPVMSQVISERVPILSRLINPLVKKILTLVSDRVKFDETLLNEELKKTGDEPRAIQLYAQSINTTSVGLEKLLAFTFGVARWPLLIAFVFSVVLLLGFVYLIH